MDATTDTIIASLDAPSVLDHFGLDHDGDGEFRPNECPACGHRSRRDTASINLDTGLWRCFRCGIRGNTVSLLAYLAGLDPKRDFRRVIELAATITGITDPNDPNLQVKIAERRAANEERRRAAEVARVEARERMPETWAACAVRSLTGERYLADRGLDPKALRDRVRYLNGFAPALPLRALDSGGVLGIQSRTPGPGEPKAPMVVGSQAKGSALFGRVTDIDAEGVDVAIIVEGLTDTLAALLAFPGCAVFGAPGFEHLPKIAAAVAERIAECRGLLLIVPDDDYQGAEGAAEAVRAAEAAGLVLDASVQLVDLGEYHDLADAWRAGWRWTWPEPARAS